MGNAMAKVAFSSWGNRIIDNRDRDPGDYQDVPGLDLPALDNRGARVCGLMGWDGIIVVDRDVSVVGMAKAYMEAVVCMLCQRCTSCRQGNKLILAALTKIVEGRGAPEDLDTIEHLANVIMVRDLLEAIEGDRKPMCSEADGHWTVEMVASVYQSHLTGRRVGFPLRERGSGLE